MSLSRQSGKKLQIVSRFSLVVLNGTRCKNVTAFSQVCFPAVPLNQLGFVKVCKFFVLESQQYCFFSLQTAALRAREGSASIAGSGEDLSRTFYDEHT
jgi:hypothetical protein